MYTARGRLRPTRGSERTTVEDECNPTAITHSQGPACGPSILLYMHAFDIICTHPCTYHQTSTDWPVSPSNFNKFVLFTTLRCGCKEHAFSSSPFQLLLHCIPSAHWFRVRRDEAMPLQFSLYSTPKRTPSQDLLVVVRVVTGLSPPISAPILTLGADSLPLGRLCNPAAVQVDLAQALESGASCWRHESEAFVEQAAALRQVDVLWRLVTSAVDPVPGDWPVVGRLGASRSAATAVPEVDVFIRLVSTAMVRRAPLSAVRRSLETAICPAPPGVHTAVLWKAVKRAKQRLYHTPPSSLLPHPVARTPPAPHISLAGRG